MKKILAVLLAVMMMLSLSSVSFAADNSKNGNLQFGADGKFDIMLVADPQDGFPIEEDFKNAFNQALDKAAFSRNSSAGRALVRLQRPLPVMRILRPAFSIFSMRSTERPLMAAVPAAISPAAPAPITITSYAIKN